MNRQNPEACQGAQASIRSKPATGSDRLDGAPRFRPYIFVETDADLSRRSTPIRMPASRHAERRIDLPDALFTSALSERIAVVGKLINAHYRQQKGRLPLGGEIRCYHLVFAVSESFTFAVTGELMGQGRACIQGLAVSAR